MLDDDEHIPAPQHKFCSKCQRILPTAAFKRFLTPAEAKSKGYSGQRPVQIETKHCKDCRPRRRKNLAAFSVAELKKKAARGEISPVMVSMIERQRKAEALAAQTGATTKRWEIKRMNDWREYLKGVQAEIRAVTQQRKHARTKGEQGAVVYYCDVYLEVLRKIKADLTVESRRTTNKPPAIPWQETLNRQEKDAIAAAWTAINPNTTVKMRQPAAFAASRFGVPMVEKKEGGPVTESASAAHPTPETWGDDL